MKLYHLCSLALQKWIVVGAMGLLVGACASDPAREAGNLGANSPSSLSNLSAAAQAKFFSGRLFSDLKSEECPVGPAGWQRESLAKLSRAAAACAQYKKNERLEQIANHLARTFGNEPWGAFYLSVAAEQRSELPRALWMSELALKKASKVGLLYYQRGRIHWALGEIAAAVADYNETLKFSPRLTDAHIVLGQLATRNQDFKSAQAHYAAAVDIEPDNHSVIVALAETNFSLGQTRTAIALYESAVGLSPSNLDYHFRLAGLYEVHQKDYNQALTVYRRIKALMAESKSSGDSMVMDVNEKIKKLEALVTPETKAPTKVISAAQPAKAQVKK